MLFTFPICYALLFIVMLEHIKDLCLNDANDDIIYHRVAHHFVDILLRTFCRIALHEIEDGLMLLLLSFLINRDELELSLVPLIIPVVFREEDFVIGGWRYILHRIVARTVIFCYGDRLFLCLCEAHCFDDILLIHFLLCSVLLYLIETDFGFKSFTCL